MSDIALYFHELLPCAPDTFTVSFSDNNHSKAALLDQQREVRQRLEDEALQPLDRVIVRVTGTPIDLAALLGVVEARGVAVPVGLDTPPKRLEAIADNCSARFILSANDGRYRIERIRPSSPTAFEGGLIHSRGRSAEEPCLIIYTSGSSGIPKGVVCSHQSVLSAVNAIQRCLSYRQDDRVALPLPLTFDYGLYQAFLCMVSGAGLVMYPPKSTGPGFVDWLDRDGITVLPSLPPLTHAIVSLCQRRARQLTGLRLLTSTGADFGAALAQAARDVMPNCRVVPMYGLTECKRATIQTRTDDRPHGPGQPIPGCRIAIVENGERLPPNRQGEIWVTGVNVMSGYWPLDDKALNSRFQTDVFGRRWIASGDRGWLDDEGDLHVVGRFDDIFKRDGYRMSVAEIESALLENASVERVCVVPPAEEFPFTACYEGDIAPQTLRAFLSERLEAYRIPENIFQIPSIPLNTNGKIDRIAVKNFLKNEEFSH